MKREYGIKIINIEASTLYETNLGIRDHFEYKKSMFTNSLLNDFLVENGLKIWKDEFTRDLICLEFNWSTRSFTQEKKHLEKLIEEETDLEKKERLVNILSNVCNNKEKYNKKTKDEIREEYYKNGVDVKYTTRNKKGEILKEETIHYKMLYRSTGKAKKGSCMFIRDRLYHKTYKFLSMGLKMPKKNAPIVELSAYMPLVASTIVDRIRINPDNILILKDVDSYFKTKVVSVETDKHKHCVARTIDDYTVKNTLFDGQALIDSSLFPSWANGCILLRHHFCKMETVNTNIQQFFQDYFGDTYETAVVTDMFGKEHFAKDIELITTDNAMKWIKFDVEYEYWCDRVRENGCTFGIVKSTHESKLGDVQRMSYQMINTLNMDIMEKICQKSIDYITKLKTDDDAFLDYLRKNENFSNDYKVLVALVEQDRDFLRSDYFRRRKESIIRVALLDYNSGRIIQNADNLVLIGSPYAMLLHSVGEDVNKDDTFSQEDNAIQCYTERFNHDEYLGGFRSPHNSPNNSIPLHNVLSDKIKKYFNFGELIIAVNVINTDIQDRANGCDFDSDTIYCTNQEEIVDHVIDCYKKFPTIVNNIPKEKKSYDNCLEHYATVDNNLAMSSTVIGESSNLAQLALTYTYNFDDQKYVDYVCILSVLAQVAIDSSKRRFDINLDKEIKRIKKDMNIKDNKLPEFWRTIKFGVKSYNINRELQCPMNYLCKLRAPEFRSETSTMPMSDFFVKYDLDEDRRKSKKVEKLIEDYSKSLMIYNANVNNESSRTEDYSLLQCDFDKLIFDISQIYVSKNYVGLFSWIVDRAFVITPALKQNQENLNCATRKNKSILLKTLYEINPNNLLKVFSKNLGNMEKTAKK